MQPEPRQIQLLRRFRDVKPRQDAGNLVGQLGSHSSPELAINPIIYAELSLAFSACEAVDAVVADLGLTMLDMPRPALFLAGKAFLRYRRARGARTNVVPDFFVGAHAAVASLALLTRDPRRYRTYFPTVTLIAPE